MADIFRHASRDECTEQRAARETGLLPGPIFTRHTRAFGGAIGADRERAHVWASAAYDGAFCPNALFTTVRFTMEGFKLPMVRCIAADRNNVLVGRNVLNRFVVTLNGKDLYFDLHKGNY